MWLPSSPSAVTDTYFNIHYGCPTTRSGLDDFIKCCGNMVPERIKKTQKLKFKDTYTWQMANGKSAILTASLTYHVQGSAFYRCKVSRFLQSLEFCIGFLELCRNHSCSYGLTYLCLLFSGWQIPEFQMTVTCSPNLDLKALV